MKWIKCSEKLPPLSTRVLIFANGATLIAKLNDINEYGRSQARTRQDKWPIDLRWKADSSCCYSEDEMPDTYTHWMNLPESPEE